MDGQPSSLPTEHPALDKFTKAALFTFHPNIEGGYTVDNGGPTNYGITQSAMDAFNNKHGYPALNVKDATPDDARYVAENAYFKDPGLENLPDRTAIAAFDYSMNSGPYQAIKDLQRVVGVRADGLMGPQTQRAVEKYVEANGEDALLNSYVTKRQDLMNNLVDSNPMKYGAYSKGWANRITALKEYLQVQADE